MKRGLFVVANRSLAKFFAFDNPRANLHHEEELNFPNGRDHDQEFTRDQPGRSYDRRTEHRHSYSRERSVDQQLIDQFTRTIAERIEKRRSRGDFAHLVLAGDPKFIGNLRARLSLQTQHLTLSLIPKDIVNENTRSLQDRLKRLIEENPDLIVEN